MICIQCKLAHDKTINLEEADCNYEYGDHRVDKTVHINTWSACREYKTGALVCNNCGLLYEQVIR